MQLGQARSLPSPYVDFICELAEMKFAYNVASEHTTKLKIQFIGSFSYLVRHAKKISQCAMGEPPNPSLHTPLSISIMPFFHCTTFNIIYNASFESDSFGKVESTCWHTIRYNEVCTGQKR